MCISGARPGMGGMDSSREYAARRLGAEVLYTPSEVAALFRVDPKTVSRWSIAGKLPSFRTLGGHRRFRASDVHALLTVNPAGEPGAGGEVGGEVGAGPEPRVELPAPLPPVTLLP